ncbi:MAG: restriction endonuclease [Thermodesulfovibrionia bacterium]|nr:restriction endonuclease [Thermodesulfovibrionia bacterium]
MSKTANIKVKKASGAVEDINLDKLHASLVRSGADSEKANEIIDLMLDEIPAVTSTRKIYRLAKKHLRTLNHSAGLRYSLKNAIFRLGPSGYPFEKYLGAVMTNYGYKVKTGVIIEGNCIDHEIDVYAVKEDEVSLVECKYRNTPGGTTDVKTALYVHSRFHDLWPTMKALYPDKTFKGWLVTNTRCTTTAVTYAKCMGLNIRSWSYPDGDSLQKMIEDKKLYPVTIISGIKSGIISTLIKEDIILLKDLAVMSEGRIAKMLSLTPRKAAALKKQADDLCLC